MKKRIFMLFATILTAALIVGACGKEKKELESTVPSKDSKGSTEVEKPEEKEEEEEEVVEDEISEGSTDFSALIEFMEEKTEGTTNFIYESDEPQVHKLENVSVSLDAYTFVELIDFHTDYSIPFKDQTDGAVILAHYTVTNEQDKDIYYMPSLDLTVTYDGVEAYHRNNQALLPSEEQLDTKLSHANSYLVPAGESVTGYVAYSIGEKQLATVLALSTVDVLVPEAFSVKDDFGSLIGSKGRFTIATDEDGAKKIADNSLFYEDRVSFENMGEKKMLKEKSGIADSQTLGETTVTIDGYQFTEFIPNSNEAPRFSSFTNGMVLLTIKLDIDNKGSEDVGLSSMNTKLTVNDGSQYLLNEGMLLKLGLNQIVKPGTSDEWLQIFVLDQEQYEKIWKEKSFELEVGPIKNQDSKDISKGKTATFTLPN